LIRKIVKLYPLPGREIAGALYEDLVMPPPWRRDLSRPYVVINMVSSIDGKTTVGGKASRIGSATDRQAMRTLRSKADAVMIGANTLRSERLSLGLDEPVQDLQPLAVIVTKSGNVPLQSNLVVGEPQGVLVITTQDAPEDLDDRLRESARVLRVPATRSGTVELGTALKILKTEHAVELLLVEGGPSLNHSLFSRGLADELFLTLAPRLLGGTSDKTLTILDGPPLCPREEPASLLSVHLAGGELFLRYKVAG
jgi:2,5-diamino-6-(ribosylamino)-4(3H)-pyrimidinone 5'-phosphate reductase